MRNRVLWLTITFLMTVSLILVSCGKAPMAVTTNSNTTAVKPTVTSSSTAVTASATSIKTTPLSTTTASSVSADKPKYGGTITTVIPADITTFDQGAQVASGSNYSLMLTNEELLGGDWSKGPAGTNEYDYELSGYHGYKSLTGLLASSWEITKANTWVFHIRQGVHWALNSNSEASRLVNGREFTADDVVFNINRYAHSAKSSSHASEPGMCDATVVKKLDAWTVQVENPVDPWTGFISFVIGRSTHQLPQEVIQKYGDMTSWKNSVGTGPFMLNDFVSSSAATFIRNPNYWNRDPVGAGKGNQLPYVDMVRVLIMPDTATQLAAIRTGKVDQIADLGLDAARSLISTSPDLQYKRYLLDTPMAISMRADKAEDKQPGFIANLPFKDIKVRQALMMATDFNTIKDAYFGGQAEILVVPMGPYKGYENCYIPMNQLPQEAQDLYKYSPDKAKKLLSDAGYPNGFTAKVDLRNYSEDVDYMSLIKSMWAKVNVNLTLNVEDVGVYNSVGRNMEQMRYEIVIAGAHCYCNVASWRGVPSESGIRNDPVVESAVSQMYQNIFDETKNMAIYKQLVPYLIQRVDVIPRPTPYSTVVWWPWLKNYHGETQINLNSRNLSWIPYVWIDQDLKTRGVK